MKLRFNLLLVLLSGSLLAQTPELGLPVGHTKAVTSVAISPDGRYVLTGSLDKLAKIWDLEGRVLRTYKTDAAVAGVGFSPRGNYVYTQYRDTSLVWDLQGRLLQGCTAAPVFSADESKILYVSGDTLWLLQLKTGVRKLMALEPSPSGSGGFSPDGQYFVRVSNGKLELWSITGKRQWSIPLPADMAATADFSPDQRCIAVAFADGTLSWYSLKGKKINSIGTPSTSAVQFNCSAIGFPVFWARIGFSSDQKKVYCSGTSGAAVYAIAEAGSSKNWLRPDYSVLVENSPEERHSQRISEGFGHILQLSPDGSQVLWRKSVNTELELINRQGETVLQATNLYGPNCGKEIIADIAYRPANAAFDPSGRSVLVGYTDGSAALIGLDGLVMQRFQSGRAAKVTQVAKLSEGNTLLLNLSAERDSEGAIAPEEMIIFDLEKNLLKSFDPAVADTTGPAYRRFLQQISAKKGQIVAYQGGFTIESEEDPNIGWEDFLNPGLFRSMSAGTVRVFDHGKTAFRFWDEKENGQGSVSDVCLSPDEKYLLTSPSFGPPRVWDFQCLLDPSNPVSANLFDSSYYLQTDAVQKCFVRTLERAPARSYFLDFAPDNRSVLLKDRNVIRRFSLEGDILQTFRGHRLDVTGATFLQNDRIVLSWSEDRTMRLWDAVAGAELATILFLQGHDWVLTTPQGLFDASPGAMEMMYYVIGIEPVEIEQIKERYYEPGLLQKLLGYHDEPLRQVEEFDEVELYPDVALALDTFRNTLQIRLSPRNGGVGKVSVFVNGKEIIEDANPPKGPEKLRDTAMTIDLEMYARFFLVDSLNSISVRAYNQAGWLKSAPKNIMFFSVPVRAKGEDQRSGAAPAVLRRNPNLFILAVGTHDYAGKDLDLKYAGKDAKNMINALQQIGETMFTPDRVFVQLLTTDTSEARLYPTKTNIQAAFDSIRTLARAEDMVLVYFSGHGIAYGDADRAQFYYLTQDIGSFDLGDVGVREKRAVSSAELTRWLKEIAAQKQVLIMDACNSGKLVENLAAGQKSLSASQIRAFDRMKDRTGMFVLTGSAADKVSYEAGQYGQGLLTYSLLEGMKGEVPDKFGLVDVMALFQYACERVPELARGIGGIQTPVPAGPLGKSFSIGISDSTVNIPIASEKDVFIRNIFQDEERFDDELGLTNAVKSYLIDQAALDDAGFIYVDVAEYDDAYSIKGLYNIRGDEIQVRARLYKGKTPLGEAFSVIGKKSQLSVLVESIVEQAAGKME